MPTINPTTSAWINLALGLAGALLLYLSKTPLPAPVSHEQAQVVQDWSGWIAGAGAVMVAAINGYLHAVSSEKEGPLAK
jgi:hypothetical protein